MCRDPNVSNLAAISGLKKGFHCTVLSEDLVQFFNNRSIEEEQEAQFKEKYGPDWIDRVQEEYGDDWPEPDYSGLGERDFDKALKNQVRLDAGKGSLSAE